MNQRYGLAHSPHACHPSQFVVVRVGSSFRPKTDCALDYSLPPQEKNRKAGIGLLGFLLERCGALGLIDQPEF